MKYVRTEDGIYEVEEDRMLLTIPPQYPIKGTNGEGVPPTAVIRQSDSIEKLCDYLFYRNRDGKLKIRELPLTCGLAGVKSSLLAKQISDVKLAILTDKGLIYVAEMNDKGELELL